jgi:hypothetical protein
MGSTTARFPLVRSAILAKAPARQRAFRPRHFAQRRSAEFVAKPQRLARHDDRSRRRFRFLLRLEAPHALFGLIAEPGLR